MTHIIKRILILLSCAVMVSSCAVLANKPLLDEEQQSITGSAYGCRSTAGEYSLPRSLLRITVTETRQPDHRAKGDPLSTEITAVEPAVQKDAGHTYCLDFLNSFTSIDSLKVEKDNNGLLKMVTVNTDDQLDEAIIKVAEAVGTISDGVRSGGDETPNIIMFQDFFDPMSINDLMLLNGRLAEFGVCVLISVHGRVKETLGNRVAQECGKKLDSVSRTKLIHENGDFEATPSALPRNYKHAVLYRPTVTADVVIMHQPNRLIADEWVIYEKRVRTLVDTETIIGFEVKRAIFAKRGTTLTFSNGIMTEVFIDKGSELAEFVQVPVAIARAVTQLPTEIVQIRLGRANSTAALINAQSQLITARRGLAEQLGLTSQAQQNFQQSQASQPRSGGGTAFNQCFSDCRAEGRDAIACEQSCSCQALRCAPDDTACRLSCGL